MIPAWNDGFDPSMGLSRSRNDDRLSCCCTLEKNSSEALGVVFRYDNGHAIDHQPFPTTLSGRSFPNTRW